jgi:hypothetical protein
MNLRSPIELQDTDKLEARFRWASRTVQISIADLEQPEGMAVPTLKHVWAHYLLERRYLQTQATLMRCSENGIKSLLSRWKELALPPRFHDLVRTSRSLLFEE